MNIKDNNNDKNNINNNNNKTTPKQNNLKIIGLWPHRHYPSFNHIISEGGFYFSKGSLKTVIELCQNIFSFRILEYL